MQNLPSLLGRRDRMSFIFLILKILHGFSYLLILSDGKMYY